MRLADRDMSTEEHTRRVALLAARVAEELKLPPSSRRHLAVGGLLHDIGKLSVPLEILNKPGSLTDEEFAEIRRHPESGRRLLDELGGFPETVRNLVSDHHERLDGTGYPRGLKDCDLTIETRILAACDVYDALVSDRVYRSAWTPERALGLLHEESGTGFDPKVVARARAHRRRRPTAPRRGSPASPPRSRAAPPGARPRARPEPRHRIDTRSSPMGRIMDGRIPREIPGRRVSVTGMNQLANARREGTGELLLTGGLLVLYVSLRGTARALGAIESVIT